MTERRGARVCRPGNSACTGKLFVSARGMMLLPVRSSHICCPAVAQKDESGWDETGRLVEATARDRAKPRLSLRFAPCLQPVRFRCTSAKATEPVRHPRVAV